MRRKRIPISSIEKLKKKARNGGIIISFSIVTSASPVPVGGMSAHIMGTFGGCLGCGLTYSRFVLRHSSSLRRQIGMIVTTRRGVSRACDHHRRGGGQKYQVSRSTHG